MRHPCAAPFSQLYLVPRTSLDIRFCPYHAPTYATDQKAFIAKGPQSLDEYLNEDPELKRRRASYLAGDYLEGAGCSPDCFWYQQHAQGVGAGFLEEDFRDEHGRYHTQRIWLSTGPDCNITCRYCLEPKEFQIDYKTCDVSVTDLERDFVAQGGNVLLTGGEPFMPKYRLLQILEYLTSLGLDKVGRFEIHTNGTYLDARARRIVLDGPVSALDVSMDTLRPELFEYLRRGSRFDQVWGNVTALVAERDALGRSKPEIKILCAVMKSTCDHIVETVDRVVASGMTISLNILFKAYYSPEFSSQQALSELTLAQTERLAADIETLEKRYGLNGPVYLAAIKGQVANLVEAKRQGKPGTQVVLGGGAGPGLATVAKMMMRGKGLKTLKEVVRLRVFPPEAPRKKSVTALLKDGQYRAAARKVARKAYDRYKALST